MDRVVEPELMDDAAQAAAYARADFAEPNQAFVAAFLARSGNAPVHSVIDLGCGPADISIGLAAALPDARIYGLDGSAAMLECARDTLGRHPEVADRVELVQSMIPVAAGASPRRRYDAVVSNSLLHHLHQPGVLWQTINELGAPGAFVLIMDLRRPDSPFDAAAIVERYAGGEAPVLKEDFYNSLLAAFTPGEVTAQVAAANLPLEVEISSDRHLLISGRLPV